jgi:F-type H+-transporting ATPase subunit b
LIFLSVIGIAVPNNKGRYFMWLVKVDPGLIFWTIVTFVLLVLSLWKFAWGPIAKGLDERAETIKGNLDRADQIRKDAEAKLVEYNVQITNARKEVEEIFQQGKKQAEENKARIMEAAGREATEIKDKAKNEIEQARKKALADLKNYVADLVVYASKKVVSESMGTDEHKKLINNAIKNYEAIDSKTSH